MKIRPDTARNVRFAHSAGDPTSLLRNESARAMSARSPCCLRTGCLVLVLALLVSGAYGQDTTRNAGPSPSDVTDDQIQSAARVMVAMQKLRDRYEKKYGNPQELDSSKVQAVRRRFRKEQQTILQQKIEEVDITEEEYRQILRRTRRDTTLRQKMRAAVLEARKEQVQREQNRNQ